MAPTTPNAIKAFVDRVAKLPGIGPRQAMRLAFHLVGQGHGNVHALAKAVSDLEKLKVCNRCYFVHDDLGALCGICADPKRDHGQIAIVEKETDLTSIERTKRFHGRYLVLGELTKTGFLDTEKKLRLKSLTHWIEKELGGKAREIILAISPTAAGDLNASLLAKELRPYALRFTRLGRGIPTGGEIEFADEETLVSALERRN
ncbi:MAG: toprim domain-containing protein [bacterium]|nr:toprim domain-containing protein [bacterium]